MLIAKNSFSYKKKYETLSIYVTDLTICNNAGSYLAVVGEGGGDYGVMEVLKWAPIS